MLADTERFAQAASRENQATKMSSMSVLRAHLSSVNLDLEQSFALHCSASCHLKRKLW